MNLEDYGKNSIISVGPWGGQDGVHWDDGVYSNIKQVEIAHGANIDSIRIEYVMKGASIWSEKHGGLGNTKIDKIKLGYPDEFLTSIHGYYGSMNEWGPILIRSLTFESNKKAYGPYGIEQGTYFSLPMIGGKIVGFHGKCGWYLDAIGVHFEPIPKPLHSYSMVQYQSTYAFNANEKCGYSTVQGNLGKNYDVIVAFRCKDDISDSLSKNFSRENSFSRDQLPNNFSQQDSFSHDQRPNSFSQQISDSRDQFTVTQPKDPGVPRTIERVPSKDVKGVVTYGPWGGTGGTVFDDGIYDGIKEIKLSRNVGIASIRILYDQNGVYVWGNKNGGTGGFKTEKIVFDYPSEMLTHITGFHGFLMGANVIRSLTFHTTKSQYGPFGEEQGQQFSTNLREGRIVGFHGRKGLFLDAIGVHVIEGKVAPPIIRSSSNSSNQQGKVVPSISSPSDSSNQKGKVVPPIRFPTNSSYQQGKLVPLIKVPSNSSNQQTPTNEVDNPPWYSRLGKRVTERGATEEAVQRIVKDPVPHGTGPWGGDGGKPWDDGVFTGIKQIILTRSQAICSIEIEYDRNGQSVWSVNHGGTGGQMAHKIKLEYPHEVVTCVSGYYGPINKEEGVKVIKSLTLFTSRRKFGPFGEEIGTYFCSGTTEGKVVGFHGRSGMYLDAIGVHMQHWLGNQRAIKTSSLMKIFS